MISLDPQLSVYNLVMRTIQQRSIISHRRTMLIISREIERVVIEERVRARVFSCFQLMSRFLPQVERYRRLAQHAESVYVFGVPDVQPPAIDRVTYVPLQPTDHLAREWFLIADSPGFFSALATEEISAAGTPEDERQFEGIWSFDEDMITILQEWLSSLVDARELRFETARSYRDQSRFMSNMLGRLTARMAQQMQQPQPGTTVQELSTVAETQVAPALDVHQANAG